MLITCEERVYDQVQECMENREAVDNSIVHVINIDIQDNLEEATIGAFLISDLCMMLSKSDDLDNDMGTRSSTISRKNASDPSCTVLCLIETAPRTNVEFGLRYYL